MGTPPEFLGSFLDLLTGRFLYILEMAILVLFANYAINASGLLVS
jgi:hypothetical protein